MAVDYKEISIENLVYTWLYEIKINDPKFKPSSFAKYEGIYRNYIKDTEISFLKVFNCKTITIQKHYNKLSEIGKTESQIKNLNKVLKGAFDYAIQEKYVTINPCKFVVVPKNNKEVFDEVEAFSKIDFDFFKKDELIKIINECKNRIDNDDEDYFPYLVLFSLSSGLRIGEASGLQYKYFHDYIINVKKELVKVKIFKNKKFEKYDYKLITPKTKNSIRDVTMASLFFDIIDNYINTIVKKIYERNNKVFDGNSLIFVNSDCGYIDQSNLRKKWVKFLKYLNIEYKKWHKLRAGFACLLFLEGVDIKTVQELLGHGDINITINIYLRVFPAQKNIQYNEINLLGEVIRSENRSAYKK